MKAKYILFPGWVVSKNDGQRHYISYRKLAALYGVNLRDCVVFDHEIYEVLPRHLFVSASKELQAMHPGAIGLHPRYDGNYTTPEAHQ